MEVLGTVEVTYLSIIVFVLACIGALVVAFALIMWIGESIRSWWIRRKYDQKRDAEEKERGRKYAQFSTTPIPVEEDPGAFLTCQRLGIVDEDDPAEARNLVRYILVDLVSNTTLVIINDVELDKDFLFTLQDKYILIDTDNLKSFHNKKWEPTLVVSPIRNE